MAIATCPSRLRGRIEKKKRKKSEKSEKKTNKKKKKGYEGKERKMKGNDLDKKEERRKE